MPLARQQLFDGEHKSGEGGRVGVAFPIASGRHHNAELLCDFRKIANEAGVPIARRWAFGWFLLPGKSCLNRGESAFKLGKRNKNMTHHIKLQQVGIVDHFW